MQDAIYTWTEDQVKDKLNDVVSEYRYLYALSNAMGKVYHSLEDAKRDLINLFRFVRIPISVVETLEKPWYPALRTMYNVSRGTGMHMTQEERAEYAGQLENHGKTAMEFLRDGKPILKDILEAKNLEYTEQEADTVFAGLKDINCDTSLTQFEKELQSQINHISQARNRILLKELWISVSGKETVKAWCTDHGAPLLWIVSKEQRKAFSTVISVQKDQRVLDQYVTEAIDIIKNMDHSILVDDKLIFDTLMRTIGQEYTDIFSEERGKLLSEAKMSLGNDMSTWDVDELLSLQQLLKKAQREKAKREKLSNAKGQVRSMNESSLREKVAAFLDAHPEFCDDFIK